MKTELGTQVIEFFSPKELGIFCFNRDLFLIHFRYLKKS